MPFLQGTTVPCVLLPWIQHTVRTLSYFLSSSFPETVGSQRDRPCRSSTSSRASEPGAAMLRAAPHTSGSLRRRDVGSRETCLGRTPQLPASAAPGGAVDVPSGIQGLPGRQSPAPPARWAPRPRSWWRPPTSRLASTDCSGGRTPKGPPTSITLSVGAPPGEQPQRRLGGGDREGNAEGLHLIEHLLCPRLCAGHFTCLSLKTTGGGRHDCSSAQWTPKRSSG